MKKIHKFNAFTLAETLLTLTIVGVIAALTIPGLRNHSDEVKYVALAQKAYSNIASATSAVEVKHGDAQFWDFGNGQGQNQNLINWYKDAMSTIANTQANWSYYNPDGTPAGGFGPSFTTADGMAWIETRGAYPCGGGAFLVDTNGPQAPNAVGVDIHGFRVGGMCDGTTSKGEFGVYPMGDGQNDMNNVWACTAYVIKHKKMPWLNGGYADCTSLLGQ